MAEQTNTNIPEGAMTPEEYFASKKQTADTQTAAPEAGAPEIATGQPALPEGAMSPQDYFASRQIQEESGIMRTAKMVGGAVAQTGVDIAKETAGQAIEVARGFQMRSGQFFNALQTLTDHMEDATGGRVKGSGFFQDVADAAFYSAEKMPELTQTGKKSKAVMQTIGGLPVDIAEFAAARGALTSAKMPQAINKLIKTDKTLQGLLLVKNARTSAKVPAGFKKVFGKVPAAGQMTDATALAVMLGIKAWNEEGKEAALPAAAGGLGLGLAIPAIGVAYKFLVGRGKAAAQAFINGITGDVKLAKDFVKNPNKYNVNPFKKTKASSEVAEENINVMDDLKGRQKDRLDNFTNKQRDARVDLTKNLDDAKAEIDDINRIARESLRETSTARLDSVSRRSGEVLARNKQAVDTRLMKDFDDTLANYQQIRGQHGDQVSQAVNNIVNKDPGSVIELRAYMRRLADTADRHGFVIDKGTVKAKFGAKEAVNKANRQKLQDIVDEVKGVATEEGIPLGYAQQAKSGYQQLGYSGQGDPFLKDLSGALDPANIVMEGIKKGQRVVRGVGINAEMQALKAANTQYAKTIRSYKEAMKVFTKSDGSGKPISDISKALRAVERGDVTAIRQIKKADSILPPEAKLLPKIEQAVREYGRAETIAKNNIKIVRKSLQIQKKKVDAEIRKRQRGIRSQMKNQTYAQTQKQRKELAEFEMDQKRKLTETKKRLDDQVEFLQQQEALRKVVIGGGVEGKPTPGLSLFQRMSGFTAYGSATAALPGAVGAAAAGPALASGGVFAALSPVLVSNLTKTAVRSGRAVNNVVKAVTQSVGEDVVARLAMLAWSQPKSDEEMAQYRKNNRSGRSSF